MAEEKNALLERIFDAARSVEQLIQELCEPFFSLERCVGCAGHADAVAAGFARPFLAPRDYPTAGSAASESFLRFGVRERMFATRYRIASL